MLLVITSANDVNYHIVTEKVGMDYVLLEMDKDPIRDLTCKWDSKQFTFSLSNVDLTKIKSVWYRLCWGTVPTVDKDNPYKVFNRLCREELIKYLYGALDNRKWISNPYLVEKAENKMYQLIKANEVGFTIPETIASSDSEEVINFRRNLGDGPMIMKAIAKTTVSKDDKVMSFMTHRIPSNVEIDFSMLNSSPAIFQREVIRQFDIRVIIANNQVNAFSIKQVGQKLGGVDWRVGGDKDIIIEPYELPKNIVSKCLNLMDSLEIKFSSMDFILDVNGDYVFIESNANGSWSFFELKTGVCISQQIANSLK